MLRKLALTFAISGLIAASAYANALPGTGITGSMHDMNMWAGTGATPDIYGRSCVFCHTPHNAQLENGSTMQDSKKPLWNRAETGWTGGSYGWTFYGNLTQDGSTAAIPYNLDPLVGPSRLCMSCHDGAIASDSHLSNGSTNGTMPLGTNNHAFITDLTITHPIGFKYSDAIAARGLGELVPATEGFIAAPSDSLNAAVFDTQSRGSLAKSSVKINDALFVGKDSGKYMTCATCHDVHNSVNAKSDKGKSYNYFLRARQEGSAICLSCHIK